MLYQRPTAAHDIRSRAYAFSCQAIPICDRLCRQSPIAPFLAKQLLKAATSIGANLEEAAAGQSRADFVNKCSIAAKEAREALYWLRLIQDCFQSSSRELETLADEANQIVAILTTIVRNARAKSARTLSR